MRAEGLKFLLIFLASFLILGTRGLLDTAEIDENSVENPEY
jgi:hypothetical protein